MSARHEVYVTEQLSGALTRFSHPGDLHRNHYVFQRRQGRNQVKRLKNESNLTTSQLCERVLTHFVNDLTINANLARGGRVESRDESEQR